jgi:hypothetical protein
MQCLMDHIFCITLSKSDWDSLIEQLHANHIKIDEGPPEDNLIEARYNEGHNSLEKSLLGS